jgi:hypothetical protein
MAAGAIAVLVVAIAVALRIMTGKPEIPMPNAGAGTIPTQGSGPPAPAYSVVEIEVTDPQLFIQFAQQLGPACIAAGGRSLTLPVAAQVLHEGEAPTGIGITIWPSVEVATAF